MGDTNSGVFTRGRMIILFVIILILGFVIFFINPESFIGTVQWIAFLGFLAFIFGGAFYFVYTVFIKPQKQDITYIKKKSLVQAAKVSKPPFLTNLYVSGDNQHQRFKLGKIIGWTRIQIYDVKEGVKVVDEVKEEDIVGVNDEDVFVVQNAAFPFSFFSEPMVIRVKPDHHTALVGDVILHGYSLVKHSEYFYLNHESLNTVRIDFNILQEAKRGVMFLMLSDLKGIVDQAIGINPGHNIELEKSKMMKLPQPPPARPEM